MATARTRRAPLVTIGYEGKAPADYLAELRAAGVTLLCDVRANASSRKPGFSKRRLAEACTAAGIRYEHRPELGIPSAQRKHVRTPEQKAALFANYAHTILPRQQPALDEIRGWVGDRSTRVALTCFEREACECHRHCIADLLAAEGLVRRVDV